MARLALLTKTLRSLFAKSGNECAFPGCAHVLVNEKNELVSQLCHIRAANPAGPRYDDDQSDEDRRSHENIILLCYRHHKETDDVDEYPAERLQHIKQQHEAQHLEDPFAVDSSIIFKIRNEFQKRRFDIAEAHERSKIPADVRIPYDNLDGLEAFARLAEYFSQIDQLFEEFQDADSELWEEIRDFVAAAGFEMPEQVGSYWENPFVNRGEDAHIYAAPNTMIRARQCLRQAEFAYLEAHLSLKPGDPAAERRKEELVDSMKDVSCTILIE